MIDYKYDDSGCPIPIVECIDGFEFNDCDLCVRKYKITI